MRRYLMATKGFKKELLSVGQQDQVSARKFKVGDIISSNGGRDKGEVVSVDINFYFIDWEGSDHTKTHTRKFIHRFCELVSDNSNWQQQSQTLPLSDESNCKTRDIREFFKPPVHKSVWTIKRGEK